LGIADPDGTGVWPPHRDRDRLRVPIGTDTQGRPVELDIKEAAEGGLGPHGLCRRHRLRKVGAVADGRAWLAARHPPEELNLVLDRLQGRRNVSGSGPLHHVAAIITNLSEESHLVAR
jgi:S-DNA-T family DNA segregation ATPase FtsK/SpoIIIE